MKIDERYFTSSDGNASEIEDILFSGENVLWRAKPNKGAHVAAAVVKMLPLVLLWVVFDGIFIAVIAAGIKSGEMDKSLLWFVVPFFAIHLMPLWMWIVGIVKSAAELRHMEYAATDKRLIIKSGAIGVDFKTMDYQQISTVTVKRNLSDKIFRVGDVYVNSYGNSAVLFDIDNPYSICKALQKISTDVKTPKYPDNMGGTAAASVSIENPFSDVDA